MPKLYTIGHSNRTLQEFIDLLQAHHITHIVDVRTIPKSRRVPWSSKENLPTELKKLKINYTHLPELGGLRHPQKDSINTAWKNAGFRGFADYMQTPEFYLALKKLNTLLKPKSKIAVMCAEALPWKCHRSLISDAEIIRGVSVFHIMTKTNLKPHQLTSFALVDKNKKPIQICYPGTLDLFTERKK